MDCGEGTRSSWTGNNLEDGPHSFVVIGKDVVENSGIYTHTWSQGMTKLEATLCNARIIMTCWSSFSDTEAPQVQFRQLPDTADTSSRFTWSSTELTIFQCSLEGARYEKCGRGYDRQWQKWCLKGTTHILSSRYGCIREYWTTKNTHGISVSLEEKIKDHKRFSLLLLI